METNKKELPSKLGSSNESHFTIFDYEYGTLNKKLNEIIKKQRNLDPEFNDIVNKNFWELFDATQ